jgi:hypothetical protein
MRLLTRKKEPQTSAREVPATAAAPERGAEAAEARRPVATETRAPEATEARDPAAEGREPAAAEAREPRPGERRRGRRFAARNAGVRTVGAAGAGIVMIARLVLTVAVLIALLIGLAIVLRVVDANPTNSIVKGIHEGANFFAGGFNGLIKSAGHPKREIAIDWGIALLVYLVVGALIARVISRIGLGGVRFHRAHGAV